MKKYYVTFVFLMFNCSSSPQKNQPDTFEFIDTERYLGQWYEYAKIPNRFQADCNGDTTATYSLNEKGNVQVENSCTTTDGIKKIIGEAKFTNPGRSQLIVTFVKFFNRWIYLFGGDYWILDVSKDYEWAVVGHPQRTYGWVLTRQADLLSNEIEVIKNTLISAGYSPCDFQGTFQSTSENEFKEKPFCD